MRHTLRQLEVQNLITEKLLQNVLPPQIIDRLKNIDTADSEKEVVIADKFASASVVFFDIVGFT